MDQTIMDLYEKYTHDLLDRREFLKKLGIFLGSAAAANALLPLLETNYARAEVVSKDDPRLKTDYINYPGATGEIRAYFARPKREAKLPGVIVAHENIGLVPHIEDVIRRVALEGFLAIGPDALSPVGGTPKDSEEAKKLLKKLDSQSTVNDYIAAVKYLQYHPESTGKVGIIGFCWGGGVANQVAVKTPDLTVAVPFYGRQPEPKDVPKIKASLLLHYGGLDKRINEGIPAFEAALKQASVDYRMYMYEGAKHAFFNDDKADRYHKEAAQLSWKRTAAFLTEKLKT
jgi:carboxymethylenebutenolidase